MARWKKADAGKSAIKMRKFLNDPEKGEERRAKAAAYAREWRRNNREKFLQKQREAILRKRYTVMSHYSKDDPCCNCCGETEILFLQFDHKDNSGAEWRRETKEKTGYVPNGNNFPYWLEKNGFPDNIQVLCANCNWGRRLGLDNLCPHVLQSKHNGE